MECVEKSISGLKNEITNTGNNFTNLKENMNHSRDKKTRTVKKEQNLNM